MRIRWILGTNNKFETPSNEKFSQYIFFILIVQNPSSQGVTSIMQRVLCSHVHWFVEGSTTNRDYTGKGRLTGTAGTRSLLLHWHYRFE